MTASVLLPTVCVRVLVDPETCNKRIGGRMLKETGRACETAIDLDYLRGLDRHITHMVNTLGGLGVIILVMPWDVDRVLYDFGFPMGPFAMSDLAGLDIGWDKANSKGETLRDRLCEMDRRGQKTGARYYNYDPQTRAKTPEPMVEALIKEFSEKMGRRRSG